MSAHTTQAGERPEVGLFVTCLVDLFRPSVGFAAVKLLEQAHCRVVVPRQQTCCGQPAWNNGDRRNAQAIARSVIEAFAGFDHVVVPSGSCAGMLRKHYPALFEDDPGWRARAEDLAVRTSELVTFLTQVGGLETVETDYSGHLTYHDGCSGLRELGIAAAPRRLLDSIAGVKRTELVDADVCCGFGGTFCVKYPEISTRMVQRKAARISESGAELVLAGDLGCLLNIAGFLQRENAGVEVRHIAELLAGMMDQPAIGER